MKRAYALYPIQNILYKDITIMIQFCFIYTLHDYFFKFFNIGYCEGYMI